MGVITGLYTWGSSIDEILLEWEYLGVFEYALPFLLIFAVVFGILVKSKVLGDNRGVNTVISLAVGLLAIQSFTLRSFFRTIFPYAAIGIAVLLVGLILTGLFHSDKPWWKSVFFGIGMLVAVIVVLTSLSSYEWSGSWWWSEHWQGIITLVIIGLLITLVAVSSSKNEGPKKTT